MPFATPSRATSLEEGAAITDLQAVLGNSRITTTQVYARMVDERMKASMASLSYGLDEESEAQSPVEMRTHVRTRASIAGEEGEESGEAAANAQAS
jgi:hypothetical protein